VNTPQFDWVKSRLPKHPQPVPPIFQPEVAARQIVYAADHPHRREYIVGASAAATILGNFVAPRLLDHYLARTGYGSQQTDEQGLRRAEGDNLWEPADGADGRDFGTHGSFDDQAKRSSVQTRLSRLISPALANGVGAAAAGSVMVAQDFREFVGAFLDRRS
jgi:hypothetical protein